MCLSLYKKRLKHGANNILVSMTENFMRLARNAVL